MSSSRTFIPLVLFCVVLGFCLAPTSASIFDIIEGILNPDAKNANIEPIFECKLPCSKTSNANYWRVCMGYRNKGKYPVVRIPVGKYNNMAELPEDDEDEEYDSGRPAEMEKKGTPTWFIKANWHKDDPGRSPRYPFCWIRKKFPKGGRYFWKLTGHNATLDDSIPFCDQIPPRFVQVPANQQVFTEPTKPYKTVHGLQARATDDSLFVSIVNNVTAAGNDASGRFPIGRTVIEWKAMDKSNNVALAYTVITVIDNEPPVFTAPEQGSVVNWTDSTGSVSLEASATDNSGFVSLSHVIGDVTYPGSVVNNYPFPPGSTIVRFEAVDPSGNVANRTAVVNVPAPVGPEISCPAAVTISTLPGSNYAMVSGLVAHGSSLSGPDAPVVVTNSRGGGEDASGIFAHPGDTVFFTAKDENNLTASCSVHVTVVDTESPHIEILPLPSPIFNDPGQNTRTLTVRADASDNVAVDRVEGDVNGLATFCVEDECTYDFPIGISVVVNFVAYDTSGNMNATSVTIEVKDNEPPVITCQHQAFVAFTDLDANYSTIAAGVLVASATDNSGGQVVITNDKFATADGSDAQGAYGFGAHAVVFTATDLSGNSVSCTTAVQVLDNQPPTVTCDGLILGETDVGLRTHARQFSISAFDNVALASVSNNLTSTGTRVDFAFPVGDTLVSFFANDTSGNTQQCLTTVRVAERDYCAGAPCGDHGNCTSTGIAYQCTCHSGWYGSGCSSQYPTLIIEFPVLNDTVSPCEANLVVATSLRMSEHKDGWIPRLVYKWNATIVRGDVTFQPALNTFLAKQSSASVTLATSLLPWNSTVIVRASAVDEFNRTAVAATPMTITNGDLSQETLDITLLHSQPVRRTTSVVLVSQIKSDCLERFVGTTWQHRWENVPHPDYPDEPLIDLSVVAASSYNRANVALPTFTFHAGYSYNFVVTKTAPQFGLEFSKGFTVTWDYSRPTRNIRPGAHQQVPPGTDVMFHTNFSNADYPGTDRNLEVSWQLYAHTQNMWDPHPSTTVFNTSINPTNRTYFIWPGRYISYNMFHEIGATIRIKQQPTNPQPQLVIAWIQSEYFKNLPDQWPVGIDIYVWCFWNETQTEDWRVRCEIWYREGLFHQDVKGSNQLMAIGDGSDASITETVQFEWTMTKDGVPVSLNDIMLSDSNSRHLVFSHGSVAPGVYNISGMITHSPTGRRSAYSRQLIVEASEAVATVPQPLVVSPSSGTAMKTRFSLSTSGWMSEHTLEYQFMYIPEGSTEEHALSLRLPVLTHTAYLPAGKHTVVLYVFTTQGSTRVTAPVTVLPPEDADADCATYAALREHFDAAERVQDMAAVLQLMAEMSKFSQNIKTAHISCSGVKINLKSQHSYYVSLLREYSQTLEMAGSRELVSRAASVVLSSEDTSAAAAEVVPIVNSLVDTLRAGDDRGAKQVVRLVSDLLSTQDCEYASQFSDILQRAFGVLTAEDVEGEHGREYSSDRLKVGLRRGQLYRPSTIKAASSSVTLPAEAMRSSYFVYVTSYVNTVLGSCRMDRQKQMSRQSMASPLTSMISNAFSMQSADPLEGDMVSAIVSATALDPDTKQPVVVSGLMQPIVIFVPVTQSSPNYDYSCRWWSNELSLWSEDSCSASDPLSKDGVMGVECSCHQLADFAVFAVPVLDDDKPELAVAYVVMGSLYSLAAVLLMVQFVRSAIFQRYELSEPFKVFAATTVMYLARTFMTFHHSGYIDFDLAADVVSVIPLSAMLYVVHLMFTKVRAERSARLYAPFKVDLVLQVFSYFAFAAVFVLIIGAAVQSSSLGDGMGRTLAIGFCLVGGLLAYLGVISIRDTDPAQQDGLAKARMLTGLALCLAFEGLLGCALGRSSDIVLPFVCADLAWFVAVMVHYRRAGEIDEFKSSIREQSEAIPVAANYA